jgi:hypothetical protein
MTPTLSEVQAWSPDYLTDTSTHLNTEADRMEHAFTSAHGQVAGSTWAGQGANDARQHYVGDLQAMTAHAGAMRQAAQGANQAAETLGNAKAEIMAEVSQAQQNGFTVDESFTVHDDPNQPAYAQIIRQPYAQAHTAALVAKVTAFTTAEQAAAAALSGQATALGAFQFSDSKPPYDHWCKREEMPGQCLDMGGTTTWPAHDKWGNESPGAFNDDVPIDTSHASMTGPDDPNMRYQPPWSVENRVPRDWPEWLTGQSGQPGGPQPFLPNLAPSLTAPPTGAQPGRTTLPGMTMLPPARNLPSSYQTGGSQVLLMGAGWRQDPYIPSPPGPQPPPLMDDPPSPVAPLDPTTSVVGHVPAGISQPPLMRAAPPEDGLLSPAPLDPNAPPEQNPQVGSLLMMAGTGCLGGAGIGADIGLLFPPVEILTPELGCGVGIIAGTEGYLGGTALNNMLNGNG